MMKCLLPKAALSLLPVVFTVTTVFSQTDLPGYEFGLNAGMLVYQGDLTPRRIGSFETQKFTVGLHASKILSPILSVRANLQIGKLEGNDSIYEAPAFRKQRNFNFTTPLTELSAQLVWNVTGSNYMDRGLSGYLFAGAGVSFLKIKRDWSRFNRAYFGTKIQDGLAVDSVHKLPRAIPVLPVGGGIKYFFNSNWAVNLEANYRLTRTDYVDGFSEAANPDNKDNYMGYSIGIIYRTGQGSGMGSRGKKNSLGCPVIRY